MEEVERNRVGERQKRAWKGYRCLLKCEAGQSQHVQATGCFAGSALPICLGHEGTSVGFREGGHKENGCWGWGEQREHHLADDPHHQLAEKVTTHWRNTSFLLRNLKKVGSQTSPRRRHVSVQACRVSDTHTCSESTGGQARGSRMALGDHTR